MKKIGLIGNNIPMGIIEKSLKEDCEYIDLDSIEQAREYKPGLDMIVADELNELISHERISVFDNRSMKLIQPYMITDYEEYRNYEYPHLTKKQKEADIQPIRTEPKIGRNALCPCGSGKKYKNCCIHS